MLNENDTGVDSGKARPPIQASLCIIGNEVLSGRTQDANLRFLAGALGRIGIPVVETRIIPDIADVIIDAVNTLRAQHRYVFVTGGIGPTHDDITTEAIAAAFAVDVQLHPEADQALRAFYGQRDLPYTEGRQKMARVPEGVSLIPNEVSIAPGYQLDNVFVLAGVPAIVERMFDALADRLEAQSPLHSLSLQSTLPEGTIATALGEIASRFPAVDIGSYPSFLPGRTGPSIVVRGCDLSDIHAAIAEITKSIAELGGEATPEASL